VKQSLVRKLGFFRDCLDAENRSRVVWHFPTSKSEHIQTVESFDTKLNIEQKLYSKINRTLDYYDREKCLIFYTYFLHGQFAVPSFAGSRRTRDIKCPIFTFPCELAKTDSEYANHISVDSQRGSINPAAKQILEHFGLAADSYFDSLLLAHTKPTELDDHQLELKKLADDLSRESNGEMVLDQTCSTSVERKQTSAQGCLYELEQLFETRYFSPPLMAILKESASVKPSFWRNLSLYLPFRPAEIPLPEVLSNAQSKVLNSAAQYPLSVVSGPPGTGKSFTIACLALREFSKGKSVLVISQNQHAVDVVRRKLIDDMGIDAGLTVLGSEQGVSPKIKAQIKLMMDLLPSEFSNTTSETRKALKKLTDKRSDLERDFNSNITELAQDSSLDQRSRFWNFSQRFSAKEQMLEKQLLFDKFSRLEDLDHEIRLQISRLMTAHYQETALKLSSNKSSRASLKLFAKSLTARNQHYQENYYSQVDFSHVLKAMPFWFCSVSNLHRLLPMHEELFDLVVIDEATQCNMSVCLPALQRAKRAVVVGDPKQLKHVSFVSYELQQRLASAHNLDSTEINDNFRGNSVLDYAQAACELPEQLTMLDEHFRSHPQIIDFSNSEFYQNSLKIMTERPTNRQRSIELAFIKGKRLSKGVNKQEAEAVLNKLESIIAEQKQLPETDVHELGVLSFFSAQASYIEKLVFNKISLNNLRRHNIRVGTPFSFQGEERDHMLISCCVDENTSGNAYSYLNRDDVFNVAITRARDYQTLFVSCDAQDLKSGSKLSAYLKYVSEYKHQADVPIDLAHDSFQNEICNWLTKRGVDVYKNYMVAGISIDIMAVFHGHAIAIDLIGFKGNLHAALSLTQFKLLQRAGLESFLLPYQEWQEQPEKVLQALMVRLGVTIDLPEYAADQLNKFSQQQELSFSAITNGLSINELNARFLRNEEVVALEQLLGLVTRYQRFSDLLNENFIPQELTFKRYLNAFNELVAYCLNNLQRASVSAELANSMFAQQKALYGDATFNNEFDDVIAARLDMIDEQRIKLKTLLHENEKALLQIDKTMLKLSNLNNDSNEIDPIEVLQELSARLELYRDITLRSL